MSAELTPLIAASVAFVGSHFLMSHPLRAPMVRAFGQVGFQLCYNGVSLAAIVWIYFAFVAVPPSTPLWAGYDDASWLVASALTLLAMVLLAGSFIGNPALPAPGAAEAALQEPQGAFRVTRHPMMWGFALLAAAHMLAVPTGRTLVVCLAVAVLALVGARFQDSKKQQQLGEAWATWEGKTGYWPRLNQIGAIGWKTWVVGGAIWLAASWAHSPLGGGVAGIFRWIG